MICDRNLNAEAAERSPEISKMLGVEQRAHLTFDFHWNETEWFRVLSNKELVVTAD